MLSSSTPASLMLAGRLPAGKFRCKFPHRPASLLPRTKVDPCDVLSRRDLSAALDKTHWFVKDNHIGMTGEATVSLPATRAHRTGKSGSPIILGKRNAGLAQSGELPLGTRLPATRFAPICDPKRLHCDSSGEAA